MLFGLILGPLTHQNELKGCHEDASDAFWTARGALKTLLKMPKDDICYVFLLFLKGLHFASTSTIGTPFVSFWAPSRRPVAPEAPQESSPDAS